MINRVVEFIIPVAIEARNENYMQEAIDNFIETCNASCEKIEEITGNSLYYYSRGKPKLKELLK